MKKTVRENVVTPYTLHDMRVIELAVQADRLTLRTQSGIVKCGDPCEQVEGYVAFSGVQWDFSMAYILHFADNAGPFAGRKMPLRAFIEEHPSLAFTVMDEHYGFNSTKYTGYLITSDGFDECILEICHEGDMMFVEET